LLDELWLLAEELDALDTLELLELLDVD